MRDELLREIANWLIKYEEGTCNQEIVGCFVYFGDDIYEYNGIKMEKREDITIELKMVK